jgi:hypothetical protein
MPSSAFSVQLDTTACSAYLQDFYRQQFGEEQAPEIAAPRDEYYRLSASAFWWTRNDA